MSKQQKILGYVRISSTDQNIDRQIIALKEMGVQEKNIYIDRQTGKNFNRPEYKKLLRRIDKNTVLYVKSIDRLGRNYKDLGEQWRIITKVKGADIVVIDMPILDTRRDKNLLGTFISDLILTLLSFVSAWEVDAISARQAEGIAAARARGVKLGRPPKQLPENFHEIYQKWKAGKVSASEAARLVNMPLSSFRYRAKAYKNAGLSQV